MEEARGELASTELFPLVDAFEPVPRTALCLFCSMSLSMSVAETKAMKTNNNSSSEYLILNEKGMAGDLFRM